MNNKTNKNGIGFYGWLGIVFITLKLIGIITWPWKWVLAPIWIPMAAVLALLGISVCIAIFGK